MLTLIVGGSASGKSAFAENYAMEAGENRIYIATMQPMDNECLARIEKHRGMRAQKNFQTVECYTGLKQVRVPKDSVVLLECMSNLTANEIYAPEGVGEDRCSEEILAGVKALENQCRHLIIVSNEVFEGGTNYDPSTVRYLDILGKINREIAKMADAAAEITAGFSMFSAIPMPQTEWTNKSMRYALCAFPLIGAVIGALVCLWRFVCLRMEFSEWILAAGICVLPVLVTGGIHLDGFCDTADALASHQDTEKKLQILKDPHMGAFAAIWLGCYFIAQLALAVTAAQMQADLTALAFGYCISRSLSGLAVASFPLAKNSGLAYTFAEYADKKKVRTFLAVLAAVLCVLCCICCGKKGIGVSIAAIGTFLYYRFRLIGKFGGLSGDLAGWFVQMCELFMLAAVVLTEYL